MAAQNLWELIAARGKLERYAAGKVFHAQDFPGRLFMLQSGYVKRYQANQIENKVIELIYGPQHIISLSQLYKMQFDVDQNHSDLIYIYQAMTGVELMSIKADIVQDELAKNPLLYKDCFYESGLRLRSNIFRLASNALKDEYKKVAHQFFCLGEEFGKHSPANQRVRILVPLKPIDMAEQLNISVEIAGAVMDRLVRDKLLQIKDDYVTILDKDRLKDIYL